MAAIKMIGQNSDEFESDLIAAKKTFTVKYTGYTTTIICDKDKWLFSDDLNEVDFSFFAAYKKIKNDCQTIAPHVDKIDEFHLSYFDIHRALPDVVKLKQAFNVDLSNCYLTTALNYGIISVETFDYCATLKKTARLKAFGMLATNYTCFDYVGGEIDKCYSINDEFLRNYFFAVVHEVGLLMEKIKSELYADYLFHWVDGIYFKSKRAANRARQIMQAENFNCSFDILDNFKMKKDDFRYIIQFGKKGNIKAFNVPIVQRDAERRVKIKKLINLAQTKNRQYEQSKTNARAQDSSN